MELAHNLVAPGSRKPVNGPSLELKGGRTLIHDYCPSVWKTVRKRCLWCSALGVLAHHPGELLLLLWPWRVDDPLQIPKVLTDWEGSCEGECAGLSKRSKTVPGVGRASPLVAYRFALIRVAITITVTTAAASTQPSPTPKPFAGCRARPSWRTWGGTWRRTFV